MKTAFRFLLFALSLYSSAPARAADYAPGSLGHLYEGCLRALQESRNPKEFYGTLCGGFAEGYVTALTASGSMKFGAPDARDPCAAEKQDIYDRLNARFCPNLPVFSGEKPRTDVLVSAAVRTVSRWIEYLEAHKGKKDPLEKPALAQIKSLSAPGGFCDALAEAAPEHEPPAVNPALLRADWKDILALKESAAPSRKSGQCAADLKEAGESRGKFQATRCGAEISGFIAGLEAAAPPRKRPKTSKACAREIARLYRSLDIEKTMCVTPDTDPRQVARLFTKRSKEINRSGGGLEGFGAVGFETIYRGFLCQPIRE